MSLNKTISEELQELQSMLLAEKYLAKLEQKIEEAHNNIFSLDKVVEKEYKDIRKLELTSTNFLFRKILGDKTEQLDIERQEYLHAVMMYRDAKKYLKMLEFEKDVIKTKVLKIPLKKILVEKLLKEREQQISSHHPTYKSKLLEVMSEADQAIKMKTEIEEAKKVGIICKKLIQDALIPLRKGTQLRDWGEYIKITDYSTEKSFVDQAIKIFSQLKIELIKFEDELKDIFSHKTNILVVDARKFDNFIKVYYNYLINDWIIRERISSIISMMEAMEDEIIRLLNTIDYKEKLNSEKLRVLNQQKEQMILNEFN